MKVIAKAVVLVILIILSIYQTSMLWFDYPSDRNFFYNIIDEDNTILTDTAIINYDLFYPKQIAVYQGNDSTLYKAKNLLKSNDYALASDGILLTQEAFRIGMSISEPISKEQIWNKPHVVLLLPFSITKENLMSNLSIKNVDFEDDLLIDRVYIYPASLGEESMSIYLSDNALSNLIGFSIKVDQVKLLNSSVERYITQTESDINIDYVSTKQNHYNMFSQDRFLPNNSQNFDLLENLYGEMYFYKGGERDNAEVEAFANYFFISPENTWITERSSEVRYGDREAIVTYNDKGLFTYELIDDIVPKKLSLNSAYDIAKKFLTKDSLLTETEYRLTKYEQNQDSIIFCFDYYHRGVKIIFSDLKEDYGMDFPMMIEVKANSVVNYQRLMWKSQEILLQGNPFEVRFQNPIDKLLTEYNSDTLKINNLYLAYHIKNISDGAYLQWAVELENGIRSFYELE